MTSDGYEALRRYHEASLRRYHEAHQGSRMPATAPGYVLGLRWFKVGTRGKPCPDCRAPATPLTGVFAAWHPGINTAECLLMSARSKHDEPAPHLPCSCGYWALWDLMPAASMLMGGNLVTAIIRGHGHVILGSKGFRCEKAEILGLSPFPLKSSPALAHACRAAREYGVPIHATISDLIAAHPAPPEQRPLTISRYLTEAMKDDYITPYPYNIASCYLPDTARTTAANYVQDMKDDNA